MADLTTILYNTHRTTTILHATTDLQRHVLLETRKGVTQLHGPFEKPLLWRSSLGQLLAIQMKESIPKDLLNMASAVAKKITKWGKHNTKNVDSITLGMTLFPYPLLVLFVIVYLISNKQIVFYLR